MAGRALALAILLAAACGPPDRTLRTGDTIPGEWLPAPLPASASALVAADSTVTLLWAFRTNDTFSCQAFDYVIRRLQGTHAASLPFAAVHVGTPSGEAIAEQFFRSRRIRVTHRVTVAPRRFRREFVDPGLPSLMVVRGGRIAWSSALPQGVATPEQVDSVVRRALRAVPTQTGITGGQRIAERARGTSLIIQHGADP